MIQEISQLENKILETPQEQKKERSLAYRIKRGLAIVSATALGALAWNYNLGNCAYLTKRYTNALITENKSFISAHPITTGICGKSSIQIFDEYAEKSLFRCPGENSGAIDSFPFGEAIDVMIRVEDGITQAKFLLDEKQFLEYKLGYIREKLGKEYISRMSSEIEEGEYQYPPVLDFFNGEKNILDLTFPLILNEDNNKNNYLYYLFISSIATPDEPETHIFNLLINTEAMGKPGFHKMSVEYINEKGRKKKLERKILLEGSTVLDYRRKFTQRVAAQQARGGIFFENGPLDFVSGHFPRGGDYVLKFHQGKKNCSSTYKIKGNADSGFRSPKDW